MMVSAAVAGQTRWLVILSTLLWALVYSVIFSPADARTFFIMAGGARFNFIVVLLMHEEPQGSLGEEFIHDGKDVWKQRSRSLTKDRVTHRRERSCSLALTQAGAAP